MKPAGSDNTILDQKDIKKTLVKILKNWYWIFIFMSLSIGASMVYLKRSTNIYGANTRILVKPQKNAFKDALSESLPGAPPKEDIANEIEVLKSTRIIDETVQRLNLDVSYYIKGRLRTGEIYQNIPFKVVDAKVLDETFYGIPFNIRIISKESFNINLEYGDYKFNQTYRFGDPVVNSKFSLVVNGNSDQIIHNSKLGEINFLFMINNHSYLVSKFQSSLRMSKDENASVIDINVEDEVPDRAIAFLDTLTHLYIDYSIAVSKEINSNTIKFVDDQLQDVEGILNGVESNLEQYQRQTGTVNTGEQGSMYLQQKAETEAELTK